MDKFILVTDYNFDEQNYLASNPDVAQAVAKGILKSGRAHFEMFGRQEQRKMRFDPRAKRDSVLREYIMGNGIEIGALHNPARLPNGVTVKYVDRMSVEDLRRQYPELNTSHLVNVDIIADGERLEAIEEFSQDFVIANHFLEHCQNPILAVENMLRVVKTSGILFIAIPDKRFTFDRHRVITPYEHLVKDYAEGTEWSRKRHFEEWVRSDKNLTDEAEIEKQIRHLMSINYSIHFHVWTYTEMVEFMLNLQKKFAFEIELICQNNGEVIFIIRKV